MEGLPRDSIISELRGQQSGVVLAPGDQGYEEARRVWNGMIERHPAAIVRCRTAEDVSAAVKLARRRGLEITPRGGGHNVAGTATNDGGMVIDLSDMNSVRLNPPHRLVHVGGGAIWRDVDAATQKYGLAVPSGLVSETGVAGLTLGGGLGWLRRKYGLSCDSLIMAELVTADGRRVVASERENRDLLWALRGGGGGLGVVTEFTFRLHPVGPEVAYAFTLYDGARTARLLRAFRDYARVAPDSVAPLAFTGTVPEGMDGVPVSEAGRSMLAILAVWVGPAAEGERRLHALRQLAEPIADLSGRVPYTDVQRLLDGDYPNGRRYYWKSTAVAQLTDPVIDIIVDYSRWQPSALSTIDVWVLGGALRREPPGGSAYNGRHAGYLVNPEANWEDPGADAVNLTWARDVISALRPHSVGTYLNFPGLFEEGERQLRAGLGDHYERLLAVKRTWDPDNVFRLRDDSIPQRRAA